MSAESGISTFRDSNGLWENYDIHEVATPEAWNTDPDLVTRFYNQRRKQIIMAEPNDAHMAVAELEKIAEVHVITQNIDDLHERAGSTQVLHLHGNIRYAKSSGPDSESTYYRIEGAELTASDLCPTGYRLRPHVVWFGEAVPMMDEAIQIVHQASHFIVIGSSLQVYPAANLLSFCSEHAKKWIIDPKANSMHIPAGFVSIPEPAGEGIKRVLDSISS